MEKIWFKNELLTASKDNKAQKEHNLWVKIPQLPRKTYNKKHFKMNIYLFNLARNSSKILTILQKITKLQ